MWELCCESETVKPKGQPLAFSLSRAIIILKKQTRREAGTQSHGSSDLMYKD